MTKYWVKLSMAASLTLLIMGCPSKKSTDSVTEDHTSSIRFDTSQLNIFPVDCSIRAIVAVDDDGMWYGGSRGQYGYTEDGGNTWIIDSISHSDQPNLEFRSIAVVGKRVFLFSVASPALLFKSTDKGKSWDVVYQENDTRAFYDAMAFWDEREGIAMGDPTYGCLSIIKTTDGGNSWKKINCNQLPEAADGEAAFAASNSNIALYKNHVWIVSGGKKARVLHSSDRGINWEVYDTPIVQGRQMTGIFSCDFYDENTGIIYGGDWNEKERNDGNKAMTHDGGKTWTLIADGAHPGYQSCVQFVGLHSSNEILTVGIPGMAFSSDKGQSWTQISDQPFYTFRKADKVIWLAGHNKIGRWKIYD